MQPVRRLLLAHRSLAALVLAAALLLRLLVPAGFMPVHDDRGVALAACPGTAPAMTTGMHRMSSDHTDDGHGDAPAAAGNCAFAALAMPILGSIDPVLPAARTDFVVAPELTRREPVRRRGAPRLCPPSRGPPALT